MKKVFYSAAIICSLFMGKESIAAGKVWQAIPFGQAPSTEVMVFQPKKYQIFSMDEAALKLQLFNLSEVPEESVVVELPMPDGTFRNFKVWQSPMMDSRMMEKYPEIKTFSAEAIDDKTVTAKLDFTLYGFHAMIFDGEKTSFINPYDNYHDGYYFAHYKVDEVRTLEDKMKCEVKSANEIMPAEASINVEPKGIQKLAQERTGNGWILRTYRLALSADSQYCRASTGVTNPSIAQCFSKMTTSMNRINGVYEKEFSVHMNFCANEDTLIWNVGLTGVNGLDPFKTINNNGAACLNKNQTVCDARIGSSNYDLGHVFTTGGGGISSLGVVCASGQKAKSCTGSGTPVGDGYDIDYVAHEMGHEFGSEHTFNNNSDGSCGGNAVSTSAYEPGSGTTIMAYAGICSPDDLTGHSQDYFMASSLVQIYGKLSTTENTCAAKTSTGNKLVYLPSFSANYAIPYKTPFELTAPTAVDSVADTLTTYCWEQYNRGDFGKRFVNTFTRGPIFRSYAPVKGTTRVFPKLTMVLAGNLSNAGTDGNQGEKAPDTTRFLTFKLTVRNILSGNGCFLFPDDTIHLDAVATPTKTGFKVTSQSAAGIIYAGGSTQTITWDVVGTNAAPVNAANVDIYMSVDGGNTWPIYVGNYPNTGTASITVPNPASTSSLVRFKVKGSGNVFFNVNKSFITVTYTSGLPTAGVNNTTSLAADTKVYPVPATDVLHISVGNLKNVKGVIINSIGQTVWQGSINSQVEFPVSGWAKGIYHLRLSDNETASQAIKTFVVE